MRELYARLDLDFNAQVSTFERKKYVSLSHEANKAMNLNAYLSLMGHPGGASRPPTGRCSAPPSSRRRG